MAVLAAMGESILQAPCIDPRAMSPNERNEKIRSFIDDMAQASRLEREQKRQWLKQQWAGLSPDERDQLRNQIREHWRRMTPEQRQRLREVQYSDQQTSEPEVAGSGHQEVHPQRLTPDERQEFRQWMRERRGGG